MPEKNPLVARGYKAEDEQRRDNGAAGTWNRQTLSARYSQSGDAREGEHPLLKTFMRSRLALPARGAGMGVLQHEHLFCQRREAEQQADGDKTGISGVKIVANLARNFCTPLVCFFSACFSLPPPPPETAHRPAPLPAVGSSFPRRFCLYRGRAPPETAHR